MQCIAQVRAGRMALGGGVLKADARKGMFRVLLVRLSQQKEQRSCDNLQFNLDLTDLSSSLG